MNNNTNRHFNLTASQFEWSLSPGRKIQAWGFNESLPGPVIRVTQGDTVVVAVKNDLPEPTMIHWHGIRLEPPMDGTMHVQDAIMPGETFEYRFNAIDAGTFWYHSHFNETIQLERGMYGALIVEERETELATDRDRVFLLDDMKLDASNNFTRGSSFTRWKERHDGREGETILINGREHPEIKMHAGQTERWRFVNASSARYVRLSLGNIPFRIIATDGGFIEEPIYAQEVLLTPGERVEILVGPFSPGESFDISSLPYNRFTFKKTRAASFATVKIGNIHPTINRVPRMLRRIEPLTTRDAMITRKVKMSVGLSWKRGLDFKVNDALHHHDAPVQSGELQVWEIFNASMMDHPFHLHGFFFQVLDINGERPAFRAWKDTVNLPPRGKVKIAWMPDDRRGMWMYHCHILEHHEAGMMGHFQVV